MTLNRDACLAVANAIEVGVPGLIFDMNYFYSETALQEERDDYGCGTAACVAGWTVHLLGSPEQKELMQRRSANAREIAREILGVHPSLVDYAFEPWHTERGLDEGISHGGRIDAEDAVAMLRHAAATGRVEWRP